MKKILILFLVFSVTLKAQQSIKYPKVDTSIQGQYDFCIKYFPDIPAQNVRIKLNKQITPLSSIPSVFNLLRKCENWKYKIKISTATIKILRPILFDSLSYKAQLGVLGHELSHVNDFQTKPKKYLIKVLFWHFNRKKIDAFEYNTDKICIEQGLGLELYSWSVEVKQKLNIDAWKGKKMFEKAIESERYMRPETICRYLKMNPEKYDNTNFCDFVK